MTQSTLLRSVAVLILAATFGGAQVTWFVSAGATPPGTGSAATPFVLIQDAIVAATGGDEILVSEGVYHERIDFLGKSLVLRSIDGPRRTIIDAEGLGTAIRIHGGLEPAVVGFTVTHGHGQNGPDAIPATGPAGSGEGGGFDVFSASLVRIERCIIIDNRGGSGGNGYFDYPNEVYPPGPGAGGGIHAEGDVVLVDSIVAGNVGGATGWFPWDNGVEAGPGGARVWGTAIVVHCTFTANSGGVPIGGPSGGAPGGMTGFGTSTVSNSIFWGDVGTNTIGPSPHEFAGEPLMVNHTDVTTPYPGLGNFSADPKFVLPAAIAYPFDPNFDLHLRLDSPCRGAGYDRTPLGRPELDFEGDPRMCGLAVGSPDCGADEILSGTEDVAAGLSLQVNGAGEWNVLQRSASAGDIVAAWFTGQALHPCILAGQAYFDGHPPIGDSACVHLDLPDSLVLYGAPIPPFGSPLMPPGGVTLVFQIPPGLAGIRCRLQGAVLTGAATNGMFALSPAVDLAIR